MRVNGKFLCVYDCTAQKKTRDSIDFLIFSENQSFRERAKKAWIFIRLATTTYYSKSSKVAGNIVRRVVLLLNTMGRKPTSQFAFNSRCFLCSSSKAA